MGRGLIINSRVVHMDILSRGSGGTTPIATGCLAFETPKSKIQCMRF